MGNTILSFMIGLGIDVSDMNKGLTDAEKKANQSMTKIGQNIQKAGLAMTAALTAPIAAAAMKFVSSASNMAESVSKVNVVFGKSADEITSWAKTSADSMGMSSQQALEAAGTYGNLFQAMGLSSDAAVDMSTSVVQLAADLASFNNSSPEETLLALRSGLSGEMEPLKKFGVAMNEAALKSMALSMGLGDNILALSEAEKMQVRYAVIMAQTSMAQGDYARTSEGLANTLRSLKADVSNLMVTIGQDLLPAFLSATKSVKDMIVSFNGMTPASRKTIEALAGILAITGPLMIGIGGIVTLVPKLVVAFKVASAVVATFAAFIAGPEVLAIMAGVAAIAALVVGIKAVIDAVKKHTVETKGHADSIEEVYKMYPIAENELYRYKGELVDFGNVVKGSTGLLGEQADAIAAAALASELAAKATDSYYQSVIGMVPQIQDLKDQLKDARAVYQNLLMNEPYNVEGLTVAAAKVKELEDAVEAQTLGFVTNMLIQKLSIDGLTEAEGEFILDYMESTGQIDEETRKQASYIMRVADELEKLQSQDIYIRTYYEYYGQQHQQSQQFEKHNYATGGFIAMGGWGLVGDSASGMKTGYEELVHAVPGGVEVFPNGQGAVGGGTGGSSVAAEEAVYMGPSADDIGRAVGDRLMQLGAI